MVAFYFLKDLVFSRNILDIFLGAVLFQFYDLQGIDILSLSSPYHIDLPKGSLSKHL